MSAEAEIPFRLVLEAFFPGAILAFGYMETGPSSVASTAEGKQDACLTLQIDMNDLRRGEAVKPSGGSVAVSADVFRVNQIVDFKFRQLIGL